MNKKVFPKHPLVKFEPKPGSHEFPYPGKQPSKDLIKNHYPIVSQNHVEGLIANVQEGRTPDPILLSVKISSDSDSDHADLKSKPDTGLYRPKGFVLPEGWQMQKVYRRTSGSDVYYWPPPIKGVKRRRCRSRNELKDKLGDNFINWDLFKYKSGCYNRRPSFENFVMNSNKKADKEKSNNSTTVEVEHKSPKESKKFSEAANRKRPHSCLDLYRPTLLPADNFKVLPISPAYKNIDLTTSSPSTLRLDDNSLVSRILSLKETPPLRESPTFSANPQQAKLSEMIYTALLDQIGPLNDELLKNSTPQHCINVFAGRILKKKKFGCGNSHRNQSVGIPTSLIDFWSADEEEQMRKVEACRVKLRAALEDK